MGCWWGSWLEVTRGSLGDQPDSQSASSLCSWVVFLRVPSIPPIWHRGSLQEEIDPGTSPQVPWCHVSGRVWYPSWRGFTRKPFLVSPVSTRIRRIPGLHFGLHSPNIQRLGVALEPGGTLQKPQRPRNKRRTVRAHVRNRD